jgi:hypothetical protein
LVGKEKKEKIGKFVTFSKLCPIVNPIGKKTSKK